MLFCRERDGTLLITLQVQPRARKTGIVGVHGQYVKIKVAAPPVDDAANEELIGYFAELLGVPKSRVGIARGGRSRHKTLEVSGVTEARFAEILLQKGLLAVRLG